jgi:hypothetical protein
MVRKERERNTNCDAAIANNSLRTSNAYITLISSMFLHFGNIVDWHANICFKLEVTESFYANYLSERTASD